MVKLCSTTDNRTDLFQKDT